MQSDLPKSWQLPGRRGAGAPLTAAAAPLPGARPGRSPRCLRAQLRALRWGGAAGWRGTGLCREMLVTVEWRWEPRPRGKLGCAARPRAFSRRTGAPARAVLLGGNDTTRGQRRKGAPLPPPRRERALTAGVGAAGLSPSFRPASPGLDFALGSLRPPLLRARRASLSPFPPGDGGASAARLAGGC